MATPKQQKLIKLLIDNYGSKGTKTLGELMILAGYSKESAKNPKLILSSDEIQTPLQEFVDSMQDRRKKALAFLTDEKLEKSEAKELAHVVDLLTKNIQLLSGGKTSNDKVSFTWEE